MTPIDTIAAICTGVGGAISIIRLSGPQAYESLKTVWHAPQDPKQLPREMILGQLKTKEQVLAVYMPEPRSYTGEDVVEIHCHGGMLNTRKCLRQVLECKGVRQAEAGEFTLRAFLNGKMDLTQAEAVMDLIHAQSEMARQSAEHQLAGSIKNKIATLRNIISNALAECESRLDFPEDVLDLIDAQTLLKSTQDTIQQLKAMYATRREGMILREGIRIAIIGKPNVGKSSLLNALLGYDRAIVSEIAGTTRDSLEELTHIRGIPVRLSDTAGIRETNDVIERMGVERSEAIRKQADIVFHLLDATDSPIFEPPKQNTINILNKCDLNNIQAPEDVVKMAVKTHQNFEQLFDVFEQKIWSFPHLQAPEIAINERQGELIVQTLNALEKLPPLFEQCYHEEQFYELAAIYLRDATHALGLMIGESVDPDILDTIFSRFCIGK